MSAAPDRVALRVVMLDTLSATNDYACELVQALVHQAERSRIAGRCESLVVFTVQGSRIPPRPGLDLRPVFPAFAAPRSRAWKAWRMLGGYAALCLAVLRAPARTVVHVQFLRHERVEALLLRALQGLGARIVHTAHNALPHLQQPWHRRFYSRWYAQVDAVQALSPGVRDDLLRDLGVPPQRVQVTGHGPYLSLQRRFGGLSPEAARAALGWERSRFTLLQFGLFKPYKGLLRLADAVCALPAALRPRVALCGGGPAPHLRAVRERLERGGRGADLWWHQRFADDATLCRLIIAADLVVFPYESVSQSGALVLALSLGKPCLCSDLPGFAQMLGGTAARACIETSDAQAFAAELQALMRRPQRLQALQRVCLQAAARLPSWDHIAESTWALWREVRAGPSAQPITSR